MLKQKWERRGRLIQDMATGDSKFHGTFNAAKRESRRLQMDNTKALGRGDMRRKV